MSEYWVQSLRSLLGPPDVPNRQGDVIAITPALTSSIACAACGELVDVDGLVLVSVADLAAGTTVVYHEGCAA